MQVDRDEPHQCLLALPYNFHGTTVSLWHGLSSGAWGLVGLHLGWTQCLSTVFSIIPRFFVYLSVVQVGKHILTWSFFALYNWKLCDPHSQATTPTTLNCSKLEVFYFFYMLSCHTPLHTTTTHCSHVGSNLHPILGA